MKPNPVSMHSWTHEFAHPGVFFGSGKDRDPDSRISWISFGSHPGLQSFQGTLAEFLVAAWHCELPAQTFVDSDIHPLIPSDSLRRRYPFVLLNEYDGLNRSGASRSDNGGTI